MIKYLFTILAIVSGYLSLWVMPILSGPGKTVCVFKNVTHVPCPGCGMSRATLALAHGDIQGSFQYHILCIPFTLVVLLSLLWLIRDVCLKRDTFYPFIQKDVKPAVKVGLLLMIACSWTINIIRGI